MHVSPTQQPAQVAAHGIVQTPAVHVSFMPQVAQTRPSVPQSASVFPCTQFPAPSQHPSQFDGPHAGGATHSPSKHCAPSVHTSHAFPSRPHALFDVPSTQFPP